MTKSMTAYHNPVLLDETVSGLDINPSGVYVDVTFGGGGHKVAAGFTLKQSGLQQSMDTILSKIKELGLTDEK